MSEVVPWYLERLRQSVLRRGDVLRQRERGVRRLLETRGGPVYFVSSYSVRRFSCGYETSFNKYS